MQEVSYDASTGLFFRLKRRSDNAAAGGINGVGYRVISIRNNPYLAHRLAWLYVHGEWPTTIDHINGIRDDNRIENLRSVTNQVNQQNLKRAQKNSSTGFLGVISHRNRRGKKFSARIHCNGKFTHLGYFSTPEEAHLAYASAKRVIHIGALPCD